MAKVLTQSDLELVQNHVNQIKSSVESSYHDMNVVINSFNNETIVNSFYASGNYGENIQSTMEDLLSAVKRLAVAVLDGEDSLVYQTQKYVNRQSELLNRGK